MTTAPPLAGGMVVHTGHSESVIISKGRTFSVKNAGSQCSRQSEGHIAWL